MAEVEVGTIIAVAADEFRIGGSVPFATLNDQFGIGQVGIPAHVVEMQVRVDHVVDSFRINLKGTQTSPQLLARLIVHLEEVGEFPNSGGTALQLSMQSSVEYGLSFRMIDQEARYRNFYSPWLFSEDRSEFHLQP